MNTDELNAEYRKAAQKYKNISDASRKDPTNSSLAEQVTTSRQRLEDIKKWTSQLKTDDGQKRATQMRKEIDQRNSQIDQVIESMKSLAAADICFLVDCTGSMSTYITAVKTQITQLTDTITAMFDARIRLAFIGYRDINENIDQLDFTDKTDSFKTFLDGVQASGGDDICEDVFSGLETVAKLNWENPNRILIHICDAPCHGTDYHDLKRATDDKYPNGDPNNRTAKTLLDSLKRLRITYCSIQLTADTKKMFTKFIFIYGPIHEINISDPAALMKEISKEATSIIVSGISSTMSAFRIRNSTVKNYTIRSEESNPVYISVIKVDVTTLQPPTDLADIFRPLRDEKSSGSMKIALNPFGKGSLRYVFQGELTNEDLWYTKMVYKEFISTAPDMNTLAAYHEQLEIQVISQFLAKTFNKKVKENLIHYVDAHVVQQKYNPMKIYQVERQLKGQWCKWNNNSGYVSLQNFSAALQAFSHWTYQYTNGRLMVVDLQGVQNEGVYHLTDPAVHCDSLLRFQHTRTNLGNKGMCEFFRTHVCNQICTQLDLKTPAFKDLARESHKKCTSTLRPYLPEIKEEDAPTVTTLPFTPGR
ncbi:unnamed protein product [Adineta ricciae]|uniref:Alpha-type protein kinase domain-containing protein n=1 Tax=Adineta ricciae TaxID=249248 RepID=A0A813S2U1_ADIRI|nr:unnamed protein product [Adineta ricciae]CAF0791417.1 unnamed protein product [Adineta ricciae]